MTSPSQYLRGITAVRSQCSLLIPLIKENRLTHFDVDWDKLKEIAEYVANLIKRDYENPEDIPPHGRWQHFNVGSVPNRLECAIDSWGSSPGRDNLDTARRLVDLFVVSVLLDAGAGTQWSYKEKESGDLLGRSEGLAVASLDMFQSGKFSSLDNDRCQVDAKGLLELTEIDVSTGLQVSGSNPILGLDGRTILLQRLGLALEASPKFFGNKNTARPGNLVDYLLSKSTKKDVNIPGNTLVSILDLWEILIDGFGSIWPSGRTEIDGIFLGDAWYLDDLQHIVSNYDESKDKWRTIAPFHKLTQWMTYSLMVPIQKFANITWVDADVLTGLPEYRNGGLLVDGGFLTLKERAMNQGIQQALDFAKEDKLVLDKNNNPNPAFYPWDYPLVEWRACTIIALDMLLPIVNEKLNLVKSLTLAQMLEAGTWKGGREMAQALRKDGGPPIDLISDGTVF